MKADLTARRFNWDFQKTQIGTVWKLGKRCGVRERLPAKRSEHIASPVRILKCLLIAATRRTFFLAAATSRRNACGNWSMTACYCPGWRLARKFPWYWGTTANHCALASSIWPQQVSWRFSSQARWPLAPTKWATEESMVIARFRWARKAAVAKKSCNPGVSSPPLFSGRFLTH